MPKGLNTKQEKKLARMSISPQRKAGMVRHANAKNRSTKHNTEMINQIGKGKSVPEAHKIAVRKVGL